MRRYLRRLAVGLLALLVLAGALALTRNRWGPHALAWALARFAGIDAEIATTRGSWLSTFEASRIRLRGSARRPEIGAIEIDEIAIAYDLRALLRGDLCGLLSVRARGVRGNLDLAAAPREARPAAGGTSTELDWPDALPQVVIERLALRLALGAGHTIEIGEAALTLEGERVELAIGRLRYADGTREISGPFLARIVAADRGQLVLEELSFADRLSITNGRANLRAIGSGRLDVMFDFEALAGVGHASLALADGRLAGALSAQRLDLALANEWNEWIGAPPGGPLAGRSTLAVDFVLPLADPARVTGALSVEAVDLAVAGRRAELLRGRVRFSKEEIAAYDVILVQAPNTLELPYLFVPRESVGACALWDGAQGSFDLSVDDLPALLAGAVPEDTVRALPPHRLELAGRVRSGVVEVERGGLWTAAGTLTIEHGRVPLVERWRDLFHEPELDLWLRAHFEDLAPLAAIFGTPPWSGTLDASIHAIGGANGPLGSAQIDGRDVRFAGRPLGTLAVEARIDRDAVHLERCSASGPAGSASCVGSYAFADRHLDVIALEADLEDLSVYAPKLLPRARVRLSGVASGVWPDLDGRIDAQAEDLVLGGVLLSSVDVHARRADGRIDVDRLTLTSPEGRVSAGGTLRRDADDTWHIGLARLAVARAGQALELARPVEIAVGVDGTLAIDDLELAGSAGVVHGSLAVRGQAGDVEARFERFDPGPFVAPIFAAPLGFSQLDGTVEAHWSPAAIRLAIAGQIGAIEIAPEREPGRLAFSVRLEDERLTIDELELVSGSDLLFDAHGAVPLATRDKIAPGAGPLELWAHLSLPDLREMTSPYLRDLLRGFGIEGDLDGQVDLSGTWSALVGRVELRSSAFRIDNAQGRVLLPESRVHARLDLGPKITIEEASIDGPEGLDVRFSGRIDAAPDAAALWSAGPAAYADKQVELSARFEALDLVAVRDLVPALRRIGGTAEGGLYVDGTLGAPLLRGELSIREGEVRTQSAFPAITGIEARLALEGDLVRIVQLDGELGGAPFELFGEFGFRGPERGAHLQLSGKNVLVYRESGVSLRADARLDIEGPLEALVTRGDLVLRDSGFRRNFDFLQLGRGSSSPTAVRGITLFSLEEAPFATMRFDVAITSIKPFRIDNNMADGGLRPDLRLEGTGALPLLRGRIYVDPTRVQLPAASIRVRSGTIDFLPERPYLPELELNAEARLYGYDITIRVSGPYDQPVVDLSSVPPLGHEDLLLLVLTGRPPGEALSARTGERAAQEIAVYLAKDVFSGLVAATGGTADEGESMAERLEVYQGQEVSRSGRETTQVLFKLREELLLENDALYLTGERDVYEHYNFGLRVVFRFP